MVKTADAWARFVNGIMKNAWSRFAGHPGESKAGLAVLKKKLEENEIRVSGNVYQECIWDDMVVEDVRSYINRFQYYAVNRIRLRYYFICFLQKILLKFLLTTK